MDTAEIIFYQKKKSISSLGELLLNRPAKKKCCAYLWQDRAFDVATKLGIDFKQPETKRFLANWLRLFKTAFKNGQELRLDRCYSFVVDYSKPLDSKSKIKLFFWKYTR